MHLLDVLVTQHALWTAKRIRRGLFGQALVDFSTESWSSIQLQESASQQKRNQSKKTPRILRNFAQARIVAGDDVDMVPGMSQYGESQEFSEVGIAVEKDDELPQPMDWDQESTKSNTDFSPTIK